MSRKGKQPIVLPKGVEVAIDAEDISVKGPKGHLVQRVPAEKASLLLEQGVVRIENSEIDPKGAFQGLYRALIANMVQGVTVGFEKKLEMTGVGYRAAVQGRSLDLQVGLSHPMKLQIPEGIQVAVEKGTLLTILGVDKQAVGQFAAQVCAVRPIEPYRGKGINPVGVWVRRKAGKAGKAGKGKK